MAAVQLEETGLHHLLRHILAVDPDRGTCRTDCIQHDFQQLVYPVHIQTRVMGENIQLKIFPKQFSITFSFIHPVHPIKIDGLIVIQTGICFFSNYLIRISLCGISRIRFLRDRIIRIGIFRIRITRLRQNLLRLLVYLKDHAAHPAFFVPRLMPDEVAIVFQFPKSGEDRIGTFLADGRQTACGELPAVVEGEHFGEKPHGLEGQILVPEVEVCHDGIATVFVYAVDCHAIIAPLRSPMWASGWRA